MYFKYYNKKLYFEQLLVIEGLKLNADGTVETKQSTDFKFHKTENQNGNINIY